MRPAKTRANEEEGGGWGIKSKASRPQQLLMFQKDRYSKGPGGEPREGIKETSKENSGTGRGEISDWEVIICSRET